MKNKINLFYIVLVVVFIGVLAYTIFNEPKPAAPAQQAHAETSEGKLPPNHPPIDKMESPDGSGVQPPSKMNVSKEIMKKVDELKHAVEKDPNNIAALHELANFMFDAHQMAEAEKYYKMIVDKEPKNIEVRLDYSISLYHQKKYDEAIAATKTILSYDAKNTNAMYNLGALHATIGKNDEAIQWWEKTIAADAKSENATKAQQGISALNTKSEK
ncbi:MAG: tetratricopeptide repeat protein [Bacteroidota bacterium]